MQGFTLAAFGAIFAVAAAAVVIGARWPETHRVAAPRHESDKAVTATGSSPPVPADPPPAPSAAASDNDPFDRLPNGQPVPPLPHSAPESVRFGVIQFPYRGAELAPKDAPSKSEALARAQKALSKAKKSFDKAVQLGSSGSTADAGNMPRGVLEPAVQYALFTLAKGQICSEPIDTPRGYWIVRRNE